MNNYTHAELLAAIGRARFRDPSNLALSSSHNAHLDTLRAILVIHKPWTPPYAHLQHIVLCDVCMVEPGDLHAYPCPTVQVVANALTQMGVLPTVVDATHDMRIDDPLDDDYEPAIDVDGYPT